MSKHPDALAAELEAAGLLTVTTRDDGEVIYALTPDGERVARQMAMSDDPDGVLDALLVGPSGP
jgi:hypothetical protein